MAEGWMKHFASELFDVYSAGTEEYPGVKPLAREVMEDVGIDMSNHISKLLSDIPNELDILITMGCGVECPYVPALHREDWGLDDPSGGPKKDFETTREIIKNKVLELIERTNNGEFEKA
jgi:arsenate reductase